MKDFFQKIHLFFVVILGKVIIASLSFLHKSGTALPGLIILKLYPNFLQDTIGKYPEKIILVTGTNGKTTTTHLLTHILRKANYKVFHNHEGSNMERGIASEILKKTKWNGQTWKSPSISSGQSVPTTKKPVGGDFYIAPLPYDFYIIESDEGSFPKLLEILKPKTVVLLNIFRDQLDRYGEINGLMNKWLDALKKNLPEKIIFNADDPNLTHVVKNFDRKIGFSVETQSCASLQQDTHNADRVFCPNCNEILKYEGGDFKCEKCGFKKIKAEYVLAESIGVSEAMSLSNGEVEPLRFNNEPIGMPLIGKYNYYNLAAAAATFDVVGAVFVSVGAPLAGAQGRAQGSPLQELLQGFRSAFGRFEKINYKNKFFHVILTKNPAGFDSVLQTIKADNLMMCLNDKIADGEDVSWIYDVDYENLFSVGVAYMRPRQLILSGIRAYDLALRLKIAFHGDAVQCKQFKIEPDMKQAFENFLEKVEKSENSYVIVTYTCLMELQKIMHHKGLIKRVM